MHKFFQALLIATAAFGLAACGNQDSAPTPPSPAKPALTVSTTAPQTVDWPQTLAAGGNIAAWQEAIIGAELGGYRITEVRAHVGDKVKKGQVLARIANDTVGNELAESRAAVAEMEAVLAEARANSERARQLRDKGFYSPQQTTQSQTAADTALARLNAAKARLQSAALRHAKADVLAPDEGIISARVATVGSLSENGKELFRLIRGGRLEWRAEVTADELSKLKNGLPATLTAADGTQIKGSLRAIAPTVDAQTRIALVYVDLPADASRLLSAGMYARGEFELGQRPALTLPQAAVLLREGFAYVFRLEDGQDGQARVALTKVGTGRRQGERIEISGLDATAQVVASGAGFLADGDTVRVVAVDKQP